MVEASRTLPRAPLGPSEPSTPGLPNTWASVPPKRAARPRRAICPPTNTASDARASTASPKRPRLLLRPRVQSSPGCLPGRAVVSDGLLHSPPILPRPVSALFQPIPQKRKTPVKTGVFFKWSGGGSNSRPRHCEPAEIFVTGPHRDTPQRA